MPAISRKLVLVLAVLLAGSVAVADAIVVAEDVLPCPVVSADSGQPNTRRLDTLAASASSAAMALRCRDMYAALRDCGRSDDTVIVLLRDVNREAEELQWFHPHTAAWPYMPCGGLVGMALGSLVGWRIAPPSIALWPGEPGHGRPTSLGGCGYGCAAGGLVGLIAGYGLAVESRDSQLASHRRHVNNLVRRVNRAIASPS